MVTTKNGARNVPVTIGEADQMGIGHRAKSVLDVVTSIALIIVAGVTVWKLVVGSRAPEAAPSVEEAEGLIEATEITNVQGNGALAIVEFSDFECPFCGEHARTEEPKIKRRFVDSGRARYVAMHFPIAGSHPQAVKAAEAAECAARQGRFWEMRSRLFEGPDAISPNEIGEHARALGLDSASFDQCLSDRLTLVKVRADQSTGRRLGVRGTPSFYIGTVREDGAIIIRKVLHGDFSPQTIESALDGLAAPVARR